MGTRFLVVALFCALAGCTTTDVVSTASQTKTPQPAAVAAAQPTEIAGKHGTIDKLVSRYAAYYKVPVSLVHRVIKRESNYDPKAYHAGNYGLMQIKYRTAKGMGYDGNPHGLLNADTNLRYAVRYLKGAWVVSGGNEKRADRLYQTGYYYTAKRKGLLEEAGWDGNALAPAAYAPTMTASALPAIGAVPIPENPPFLEAAQTTASPVQPLPQVAQLAAGAQAATAMAAAGATPTSQALTFTGPMPVTPEKAPLPQDPPYLH
ncbi:MAG TPA: lytic transglycosylase domain-containing protein [Rhizobiaceae bacterium]|nr:lytic transglycosylase domain-containing protein [Rhizobiaceae bacterium]